MPQPDFKVNMHCRCRGQVIPPVGTCRCNPQPSIDLTGKSKIGKMDFLLSSQASSPNLLPCDGILTYQAAWMALPDAERLFLRLQQETAWEQREARIMGRKVPLPRLTAWHGDAAYTYSGIFHAPLAWTESLLVLKAQVEKSAGTNFNSALLNLYRNGGDSMGWHADDEKELGPEPVIASVSLGACRKFRLRHRDDHTRRIALDLVHGSLVIMAGRTQACWQHQVPKTARAVGPRINLTFRLIR